jgi:hypothetical protein
MTMTIQACKFASLRCAGPHYTARAEPAASFEIVSRAGAPVLKLRNNEVGFTFENIKALCSVGDSTKKKQKHKYIGEKGIGWKARACHL